MRTVAFIAAVVSCFAGAPAQVLMTQSVDNNTITASNSVRCDGGGTHTDNSYWRSYSLANHGITTTIDVTEVRFGVELATSGSGQGQPVEVRLYLDPTPAVLMPRAGLTAVYAETLTVPDMSMGIVNHVLSCMPKIAVVTGTEQLVIELFTPDGSSGGNSFFIGSNSLGQTGPTYLSAPGCGVPEPMDTAQLGFGFFQAILDLNCQPTGTGTALVPYPGTCEDFVMTSAVNSANLTRGPGLNVKTINPNDALIVNYISPGQTFNSFAAAYLTMTRFVPGTRVPEFDPFGPLCRFYAVLSPAQNPTFIIAGPGPLGVAGITRFSIWPPSFSGWNILLQAVAASSNAKNGHFAASEGHVFVGL